MKKSQKAKVVKGMEIGGAITAAVLAASAGAYLLSDKKRQAKMKAWAKKARVEVAKKAKVAKRLGKKEYGAIVDQVMKNYGSLQDVSAKDLIVAGRELKSQWDAIQKQAMMMAKPPKKSPARKRKKAAKKTAVHKSSAKKASTRRK